MRPLHLLVTGGSGYIGHALVHRLWADGYAVSTLLSPRASAASLPSEVSVFRADLRDQSMVAAALRGVQYDAVYHLAALSQIRASFYAEHTYWDVNVQGTANLLRALERTRRSTRPSIFVLASSAAVYSASEQSISEDHLTKPASPYGRSKLAAERVVADYVAASGIAGVILRLFNVAGAVDNGGDRNSNRLVPSLLAVAAGARPYLAHPPGLACDVTHVADIVDALLCHRNAQAGQLDIFNVGTGIATPITELAHEVEHISGHPVPLHVLDNTYYPPPMIADPTRISRSLGWHPTRSHPARIVADAWRSQEHQTKR